MSGSSDERRSIPRCPVCRGAERTLWLRSFGFDLVRCEGCGHRYSTEVFSADDLARSYYNEPDSALQARSDAAKRAKLREYTPLIAKVVAWPGRVLDVGCNGGELLELFREAGWDVAGVEASPGPAAYARARLGGPIFEGLVEDVLPEEERFDLITVTHVLEHIPEPWRALSRLRRALRPGGALLIEVPNADDALIRVFGGYYRPLCPGDHVSFFDERSLRRLLDESGLSVVDIDSPVHARDFVYAGGLSAVDWIRARALGGGGASGRDGAARRAREGVNAQMRYRGPLRTPLLRAIDRCVEAIDPVVVAATRSARTHRTGPTLITTSH